MLKLLEDNNKTIDFTTPYFLDKKENFTLNSMLLRIALMAVTDYAGGTAVVRQVSCPAAVKQSVDDGTMG